MEFSKDFVRVVPLVAFRTSAGIPTMTGFASAGIILASPTATCVFVRSLRQKSPGICQGYLFKYFIHPLAILDISRILCASKRYFLSVIIFSSHIKRVSLLTISICIFSLEIKISFLSFAVKAAAILNSKQFKIMFSIFW